MATFVNYSTNYEPLIPHLWDETNLCVKNPAQFPRWLYLFAATAKGQEFVWPIALALFGFGMILVFLFSGFERLTLSFFTSTLYLGAAILNMPVVFHRYVKKSVHRILFIYLSFAMFFTIGIFNSYLYNILMNTKYLSRWHGIDEIQQNNFSYLSSVEFLVS